VQETQEKWPIGIQDLTIGWNRSRSNRVFHEVRKTQHLNPEFGPKPDEIEKKTCKKSALAFFKRGMKLINAPFFGVIN
jgi:hypothetical protein